MNSIVKNIQVGIGRKGKVVSCRQRRRLFSGPALVITAAVVVVVAVVVVAIVVAAVVVVVVFFVFFFFGSNDIKMGDGDNIFEKYLVMFFLLFC